MIRLERLLQIFVLLNEGQVRGDGNKAVAGPRSDRRKTQKARKRQGGQETQKEGDYKTDALTIARLGEHSQTDETCGTCEGSCSAPSTNLDSTRRERRRDFKFSRYCLFERISTDGKPRDWLEFRSEPGYRMDVDFDSPSLSEIVTASSRLLHGPGSSKDTFLKRTRSKC